MHDIIPVSFALVGTTVKPEPVLQYLFNTDFRMCRYAQQAGLNPLAVEVLYKTEFISVEIRHYVAGYQKTLHRTLKEVREFLSEHPDFAPTLIRSVFELIRTAFLENEWYELMPRFEKAVARIEQILPPQP